MARPPSGSSRTQRNIKEKNRRMRMKALLCKLASLIPPQPSKMSVPEIVDRATSYALQLQKNEESLMRRLTLLRGHYQEKNNLTAAVGFTTTLPIMNITNLDSILEINLICGLMNRNFMLYEIIRVLQDEGGEIIVATQLNAGDRVIYVIKCKATVTRIGMDASRVQERLKELFL